MATVFLEPFMLTYVTEDRLGNALTMLYTGSASTSKFHELFTARVGRYEAPKHFFRVLSLSMTETGKLVRRTAHTFAELLLNDG